MEFEKWAEEYELEHKKALKKWQDRSKLKSIIPKGFGDKLLQQYVAYRNEMATKKLVRVTWVLAIATIILSISTLYFNYWAK